MFFNYLSVNQSHLELDGKRNKKNKSNEVEQNKIDEISKLNKNK